TRVRRRMSTSAPSSVTRAPSGTGAKGFVTTLPSTRTRPCARAVSTSEAGSAPARPRARASQSPFAAFASRAAESPFGVFARRGTYFELSRFAVLASLLAAMLAQAPTVELEWSAPDSCPPREAVLASVQRRLGASPEARPIEAHVTLFESDGL